MREPKHLPTMVDFVRKHVAQHFQANRSRPSPAVSAKHLDAALTIAKRFGEHLRAPSGALGQTCTGLLGVQCVRLSCVGIFKCGAVSLTHLQRTLCM
jgi:hypothetical protein